MWCDWRYKTNRICGMHAMHSQGSCTPEARGQQRLGHLAHVLHCHAWISSGPEGHEDRMHNCDDMCFQCTQCRH